MSRDIDLVLPCYNPRADFEEMVFEYFWYLKACYPERKMHLYVVNDGSVRNFNGAQIKKLSSMEPVVQVISYPMNRGKGYALRRAVALTTSPFVIYTDYDFPFRLDTMKMLIEELDKGADIVMVGRNHNYLKILPPKRRFYSNTSRFFNKFILGLKYPETQGGLKGFNENGKKIFLRTTIDEFLFDTEFIYRASLEKDINIVNIHGFTREGIKPNKVPFKVIRKEFLNFIKILRIKSK
jgi:glycosyltransferase involved in cell wall biosynthesis